MLIFLYSALIVVFDQLFKQWIILTHDVAQETVLIPGFFSLFRLHNPGAAFGFMADLPWWVLAVFQLAASIALIMIILRYTEGFWGSLGLASVLGGAVGNLVDRIMHGYVVDMFRFTFIDFAIFNLADVFITLGFLMFLIHFIVFTFKSDKNKEALADGDDVGDYDEERAVLQADASSAAIPAASVNPVATTPQDAFQPSFDTVSQAEPIVYDAPIPEAQPVVQPMLQQMPDQAVQPVPQQVLQPIVAPPITPPALPATPVQEHMTQPVDPTEIFAHPATVETAKPPVEQVSHTGPLPTNEIKPLLDHVYGGQYIAKLQEQAAPAQPVAQPAPAAQDVAPVVQAAPATQDVAAMPAPTAQPVAMPQAAPATAPAPVPDVEPMPVAQAAPVAKLAPSAKPAAPTVKVTPTPKPAPAVKPTPSVPVEQPVSQAPPMPMETEVPSATEDNHETMLDALTALESELLGENALDDYNADKLLGEYGFESDENNNN